MGYRFKKSILPALESIVEVLILTMFTQLSATYILWLFINDMYTVFKKKKQFKKIFCFSLFFDGKMSPDQNVYKYSM